MNEQTRLYETPVAEDVTRMKNLAGRLLNTGRQWPTTRDDLAAIYGDRRIRKLIEEMRDAGVIIINEQDGRGYYIAGDDDKEAVLRQYRADEARAKSILRRQKHLRRWLRERGVEV